MPKRIARFYRLNIVTMCVVTCLCSGCEKKTGVKTNGQEVAHVGSDDITTSELQLETRLANSQQAPTDRDKAIALQRIAARKSLAQKALAQGLDRQPAILLEIRRAKDQILANAVAVADVRKDEQKIGLDKINTFMSAHPYQFSGRTLLQVDELLVASSKDINKLVEAVKTSTALGQVEAYLTSNNIPFQKKEVELDTINLPDALSKSLLNSSTIPVIRTPTVSIFMQVKQTKSAPISGAIAEKAAKAQMTRDLFETEMSAPGAGDDVSYMLPYKTLIDEMKTGKPQAAKPASTK